MGAVDLGIFRPVEGSREERLHFKGSPRSSLEAHAVTSRDVIKKECTIMMLVSSASCSICKDNSCFLFRHMGDAAVRVSYATV